MNSPPKTVECPRCGHNSPLGSPQCGACGFRLASDEATMTNLRTDNWSRAETLLNSQAALQVGSLLAERYEILQLLGLGGMGAVYKARDRELDRLVALKVIRPEMASQPEILKRFKQELILARQVTHKNVIRIFDLGVADGRKFITMEFVEGRDLKTILIERGKFAPQDAVEVIVQVARG